MKKKKQIIEAICIIFLMIFSFFYTHEAVQLVRKTDPIMQQIEKVSATKKEDAMDAMVIDDSIIPGYNGKIVNKDESFQKMKQYGEYNESLLVFEEVTPTISLDEYYDKYISSGNTLKEKIALVFEVKENDDPSRIVDSLNQNNARATFFVDGKWLENHTKETLEMLQNGHEVEVLSYDNGYDEILFQSTLDVLESISNMKPQYCYAKYDNQEVMSLCEGKKMHTIIPTLQISSRPYVSLKNKVEKGSIVGFELTKEVKEEIGVITNYLKSKGYVLDRLDSLLNEARDDK